ncbi:MAG: hypothetical protein QM503_10430 [Bacteroidota bacterium]
MGKEKIYPLEVLLIERNPTSISLVKRLLNGTKIHYKLHIVDDEKETYAFLQKEGGHKNAPIPDAIIHGKEPSTVFEDKIISFLNSKVLFLKVTNDIIEITKSNKHLIDDAKSTHGLTHVMEAIVSVKKFMGSLVKVPKQDNLNNTR